MKNETLIGPITVTSKGVGYFDPAPLSPETSTKKSKANKLDSIEIQPENINRAFNGDIVEIEKTGQKIKNRDQGRVLRVINRTKSEYVGTVEQSDSQAYVIPDDKRMYADIYLSSTEDRKIPVHTKVLVEIDWEKSDKDGRLTGNITKIIGSAGENNTEMEAIVLEKGFRVEFPLEVEAEAEKLKLEYENGLDSNNRIINIGDRRDMRDVTTMTIDPFDAKDFDDAISLKYLNEKDKDGNEIFEIGVHIADVSHFVTPGTALDKEAEKRGLSVYLVDRTIPMLPEVLSNDLCSLNPHEDKFTFSSVFKINEKGEVLDKWFGRTVIHSDRRFTYEDAQEVINSKEDSELASKQENYWRELQTLHKIAKIFEKQKFNNGAINFEVEEVKFVLDEKGKPIKVYKKQRLDTHKLVEEFMLLANREVAEFVFRSQNLHGKSAKATPGKQSVYRIHDKPDTERIESLATFLKAIGFNLHNKDGKVTSRDINQLLKEVEGTPQEELVKTATIRSMAKAIYSTKNIGHFGLAFQYYTHFTSPIRRYPDLLVHRFLERELKGGKIELNEFEKYERICMESSENEKRAADAERASIKYKQVEYMENHLGEVFDGTISGVTEWGIYIEEKETKCEGMVKLRDLTPEDFYVFDEKNYAIVGEKTKQKFTLGDSVKFKVVSADMERRVLDYALV